MPSPSLQDIHRRRQTSTFVGRIEQLEQFRQNLDFGIEDERRRFVFNVWGQAGVGKTTLLRQFEQIARANGALTAWSNDQADSLPQALNQLVEEFRHQGESFKKFTERYQTYLQRQQEIEADPDKPHGITALLGETLVRTTLRVAKLTPAGPLASLIDEDAAAKQAGAWSDYVIRKVTNKDEVQLILKPADILTPLFLAELGEIAAHHPIAIFFDTYERTTIFLEHWLLAMLEGQFGETPANLVLTIAGRNALNDNVWSAYAALLATFPLEPFTEEEARDYLARRGIAAAVVVDTILRLSGRLPVLVATMAAPRPTATAEVEDRCQTAVERFLSWESQPTHRKLALHAALPRFINQDMVALLAGPEVDSAALWTWLSAQPFVQMHGSQWGYHAVVRDQMLRYQQRRSPQEWSQRHGDLSEYYSAQSTALNIDEAEGYKHEQWQALALEVLYHRLCQNPIAQLPWALNQFLRALKYKSSFALQWAATLEQGGLDVQASEVSTWGQRLRDGLQARDDRRHTQVLEFFATLLSYPQLDTFAQVVVWQQRGATYWQMERYDEAVTDFTRAIELDPKTAWVIVSRGFTYQAMERYDNAITDFTRAIELDPKDSWPIVRRGETYRQMKRYDNAITDFTRAIELDPKDSWPIAHRGITYQTMERYNEAIADFTQAIELDPKTAWVIVSRGFTYQTMERYDEAIADFTQAIELDSKDSLAIASRGETYRLMGRYDEAVADLTQAIELDPKPAWAIANRGETYRLMRRYDEAAADFTQAIELDPKYTWAIASRGETYRQMERYDEAVADLTQAMELGPKPAWVIANRGETYRLMRRYDEAVADFTQAMELDPKYAWAIASRGQTYRLMGRYDEAVADFTQAMELDPKYTWAIASRGETYRLMGRCDEAVADFTQAMELDPKNAWVIASRGQTYRQMERYDEAVADFTQAMELDPKYTWAIANRGKTYQLMGRYDEAVADFTQAMELDPKYAWAIASRGQTYRLMGRYDEAVADFTQAMELDPKYTWAIASRGETYRLMGRCDEAVADLTQAIELDPKYTWAIANRGETYQLMGRYDEAVADFTQAMELDPKYTWAIASRGETYRLMGRCDEAVADLTQAIELDSNRDWHLYLRSLTYYHLQEPEKSDADLENALHLARQKFEQAPENWRNTLNLALYCLAAANATEAERLYHLALNQNAPVLAIHEAYNDLELFLRVCPEDAFAQRMRDLLHSYTKEQAP